MSTNLFSELALDELADRGISPEYIRATGLNEREPGVFEVPYRLRNGEPTLRRWTGGYEGDEWPAATPPGVWWPAGPDGVNVLVCLGASDALFLTQQLFSVGFDGRLWRRPDLTTNLREAAIVALPQDLPGHSYCWYRDPRAGARALIEEISPGGRERAFLTVPRVVGEGEAKEAPGTLSAFTHAFMELAPGHGVESVPVLLPWLSGWQSLLNREEFGGAKARTALGGIVELESMTHYRASLGLPSPTWPSPASGDDRK